MQNPGVPVWKIRAHHPVEKVAVFAGIACLESIRKTGQHHLGGSVLGLQMQIVALEGEDAVA